MHQFPIYNYKKYADLPLAEMDSQRYAIYIVDFDWVYLFINSYALEVHGMDRNKLNGENLWNALVERMNVDSQFKSFIEQVQNGKVGNITTISSITNKRVSVTGYPLEDCYYFAVTILPDKDDLINELRNELKK